MSAVPKSEKLTRHGRRIKTPEEREAAARAHALALIDAPYLRHARKRPRVSDIGGGEVGAPAMRPVGARAPSAAALLPAAQTAARAPVDAVFAAAPGDSGKRPASGPGRKWRASSGMHNGAPAVIIRETGEAIPVENLFMMRKAREAAGLSTAEGKFEECWVCGGTDHRRSDCPKGARRDDGTVIQATIVCLGCRRRGHRLAECPERGGTAVLASSRALAAPVGAGAGAGAAALCYRCGGAHHLRDCPEPSRTSCAGCGSRIPRSLAFSPPCPTFTPQAEAHSHLQTASCVVRQATSRLRARRTSKECTRVAALAKFAGQRTTSQKTAQTTPGQMSWRKADTLRDPATRLAFSLHDRAQRLRLLLSPRPHLPRLFRVMRLTACFTRRRKRGGNLSREGKFGRA